eukprot:g2075.t1
MSDNAPPNPGLPPDFAAGGPLGSLLNDPAILEMAQELQRDPAFQQMQQVLQQSFGMGAGVGASTSSPGEDVPPMPTAPDPTVNQTPPFAGGIPPTDVDPTKAFEAMQKLYSNPQFLQMAEKIGQTMLQQNPVMRAMMDPTRREAMQEKFEDLKKDPELASVMEELESGDPQAMMKYWNNPDVLKKFSEAVEDVLGDERLKQNEGAEAGDEEQEEEEIAPSMQLFAGEGDVEGLKELMNQGVSVDDKDEEGRTGFHFACGYGEMPCIQFFLENGADVNLADNNKNTAMHYAAGYGQEEAVKILLEKNCDLLLQNADGNTAKEVAELNEKHEIVKMLEVGMAQQEMQKSTIG